MMTVATAAVGLLPTWSLIGPLAPASLLLLRLAQGFSAGGEVPSSVAYLVESAPDGRRGWYGGWHTASIALGLAGGYGVAALLSAAFSGEDLVAWGWRLAFLSAAPLGLVARYIRHRLNETPLFDTVDAPGRPRFAADVVRRRGGGVARGFLLVTALTVAFNLWFVFLPGHLVASGAVPLPTALGSAVLGLLVAAGTAAVMGRLSDRVGRRAVLIAGTFAMAAFAVPGFSVARGSITGLLLANVAIGGLIGMLVVTAFVAELFPTAVRATGVAVTYGLATAVFGGTAPLVAAILVDADAAWVVPAYLSAAAVLALGAAVTARETAFTKLT